MAVREYSRFTVLLLGAIAMAAAAPQAATLPGMAAGMTGSQGSVPSEEASPENVPENPILSVLAGLNVSDLYLDESGLPKSRPGWNYFQAGLQTIWHIGPYLGLQANILFSRKGVVRDFGDYESSTELDYAEIPLLLRIRLGNRPREFPVHLLAGGYGAFLLDSHTRVVWETLEGEAPAEGYQDWDYGPALGLACRWGSLSLEGLYSLGLADLREGTPQNRIRMGSVSLMLGLTFYAPQSRSWP